MSTPAVHERYRELLAQWPVPSEQLRVPTGLGETFVMASGPADAPALVLLHGSGSTSAMWMGDGRVRRLALVAPAGIGRQKLGIAWLTLFLLPLGRPGRKLSLRLVLGMMPPPAMTEFVLLIHKDFRPRREPVPVFSDEALAALTMPVLAVVGGRDALLDSAGTKARLERHAPDATVDLLPAGGHLLPNQTERIAEFMKIPEAERPHPALG